MPTQIEVQKKKAIRFTVLHHYYDTFGGKRNRARDRYQMAQEIAEASGLDGDDVDDATDYLVDAEFLDSFGTMLLGITQAGIEQVEAIVDRPSEPTDFFPSLNIINTIIVLGSTGAIQTGSQATSHVTQARGSVSLAYTRERS